MSYQTSHSIWTIRQQIVGLRGLVRGMLSKTFCSGFLCTTEQCGGNATFCNQRDQTCPNQQTHVECTKQGTCIKRKSMATRDRHDWLSLHTVYGHPNHKQAKVTSHTQVGIINNLVKCQAYLRRLHGDQMGHVLQCRVEIQDVPVFFPSAVGW